MKRTAVTTGNREQITVRLNTWLQPGDRVLVKGSRAMAMEKVTEKLRQRGGGIRPPKD
jgi:UDP-N-acetylmuramyl pentapeptide synthase